MFIDLVYRDLGFWRCAAVGGWGFRAWGIWGFPGETGLVWPRRTWDFPKVWFVNRFYVAAMGLCRALQGFRGVKLTDLCYCPYHARVLCLSRLFIKLFYLFGCFSIAITCCSFASSCYKYMHPVVPKPQTRTLKPLQATLRRRGVKLCSSLHSDIIFGVRV